MSPSRYTPTMKVEAQKAARRRYNASAHGKRTNNAYQTRAFRRNYPDRAAWLREQRDGPCMDCGGRFPAVCMDFDHVRGKHHEIAALRSYCPAMTLEKWIAFASAELALCDLVCSNCHRLRTAIHGVGHSPHATVDTPRLAVETPQLSLRLA